MPRVGATIILPIRDTAPSVPILGEIYFDSTLGYAQVWNGTQWVALGGMVLN